MGWHANFLTDPLSKQVLELTSVADNAHAIQQLIYSTPDVNSVIRQIWWPPGGPTNARDVATFNYPTGYAYGLTSYLATSDDMVVVHLMNSEGIQEVWWVGAGEPPGVGNISSAWRPPSELTGKLASHFLAADASHHVFVVDSTGHLIEFHWVGSQAAQYRDLTLASRAPLVESGVHTHVLPDSSQHAFYVSAGHLFEIFWTGDDIPGWRDLSQLVVMPPLGLAAPTGYASLADAAQYIYVQDQASSIVELSWYPGHAPQALLLTGIAHVPQTQGIITSQMLAEQGTYSHHVFFSNLQHVYEIRWFEGGEVTGSDLSAAPLDAPLTSIPLFASHTLPVEQSLHLFYQALNGRLVELWYVP